MTQSKQAADKHLGYGILYIRRSDTSQEHSLEDQVDWAVKEAQRLNVRLNATRSLLRGARQHGMSNADDLYLDDGISGSFTTRPGFSAFQSRAITDGTVTHVFYWSRDRLSRAEEPLEPVLWESKLRKAGKTLVTHDQVLLPSDGSNDNVGDTIASFLEFQQARNYLPKLSSNVLRGQASKARQGLWVGGRPGYGLVRVLIRLHDLAIVETLPDHRTVKDPTLGVAVMPGDDDESKAKLDIVRRIAFDYYNGKGGLPAIAKSLNEDCIPSPNAGKARKGKVVSGKWNARNVRNILENPLYKGEFAWGRTAEGKHRRLSRESADSARTLTTGDYHAEHVGDIHHVKKVTFREKESWLTAPIMLRFDPIVLPAIWDANFEKLKARGKQGGRRGVPKCPNPNRYPLEVICADCGKPMLGSPGSNGIPRYLCSTYSNTGGQECRYNWVERDVVVWFAVNGLRQLLQQSSLKKHALTEAVRAELMNSVENPKDNEKALSLLLEQQARLQKQIKNAIREKTAAPEGAAREAVDDALQDLYREIQALAKRIARLRSRGDLGAGDVEAEISQAMAILDQLHLFLERIPENRLRETFSLLGARLVVKFERPQTGRRKSAPVSTELIFGKDGEIRLPAGAFEPAPAGRTRMLGIRNRGDKI